MSVVLFHKPGAGEGDWSRQQLLELARAAGLDPSYFSLDEAGWEQGLAGPLDMVLVAGGDGTVERVACGLRDGRAPLVILPTGGSNNVARSFDALGAPDEVMRRLADARRERLHVALAAGAGVEQCFLESTGVGAFARAGIDGPKPSTREEKIARGRAALGQGLREARPVRCRARLDGDTCEIGEALMLEVLNVRVMGPNLRIVDGADDAGPGLEVAWLPAEDRARAIAWLDDADAGEAPLRRRRAARVELELADEMLHVGDDVFEGVSGTVAVERIGLPRTLLVPGEGEMSLPRDETLPEEMLAEVERVAAELAALAGAEIVTALGGTLAVRYKGGEEPGAAFRDPVSEVDHRVEALIRSRLAGAFPDHGVLGEEMDYVAPGAEAILWAVDPVDGTTNFINGFPLFAASIGVLHRGRPVAGAVWCSATHALRPGVYHARRGGRLRFESEVLELRANPAVRRRLMGAPDLDAAAPGWDVRKTGSAAIECAFVAAGLLEAARFARPNVWDVAGGIPLVEASGGAVRDGAGGGWRDFTGFDADALGRWRGPLAIGAPTALDAVCG